MKMSSSGRYIPPHKRQKLEFNSIDEEQAGNGGNVIAERNAEIPVHFTTSVPRSHADMVDKDSPLFRKVRGLINRLADNNLIAIGNEFAELYEENSTTMVNRCLSSSLEVVLDDIKLHKGSFPACMSGLMFMLHLLVGVEVTGPYLEKLALVLSSNASLAAHKNAALCLCGSFLMQTISASLIFDFLLVLSQLKPLESLHVELIYLILKQCGYRLRKADPHALKNLIIALRDRFGEFASENSSKGNAAAASADEEEAESNSVQSLSSRAKILLSFVTDLKNNAKPPPPPPHMAFRQTIIHELTTHKRISPTAARQPPHQLGWEDLTSVEQRGRWWIVGAAWDNSAGGDDLRGDSNAKLGASHRRFGNILKIAEDLVPDRKYWEMADKMKLGNDLRKSIFVCIISASDPQKAVSMLSDLKLSSQQSRETILVLIESLLKESGGYNPFYSSVALNLLSAEIKKSKNKDTTFTLRLQLRDRWNNLCENKNGFWTEHKMNSLARFYSLLISRHAVRIADVLKECNCLTTSQQGQTFLCFLVASLLSDLPTRQDLSKVFVPLAHSPSAEIRQLRDGLLVFLNTHFPINENEEGKASSKDPRKRMLVRQVATLEYLLEELR